MPENCRHCSVWEHVGRAHESIRSAMLLALKTGDTHLEQALRQSMDSLPMLHCEMAGCEAPPRFGSTFCDTHLAYAAGGTVQYRQPVEEGTAH